MASIPNIRAFPYVKQYSLPPRQVRRDSDEERPPRFNSSYISNGALRQSSSNKLTVSPKSKQIVLYDSDGKPLIRTKRIRFRLRPTYKLISTKSENKEQEIATVKKTLRPFGKKFDVKSMDGTKYSVKNSDGPEILFTLMKQGETVATVRRGPVSKYENVKLELHTDKSQDFVTNLVDVLVQILYGVH